MLQTCYRCFVLRLDKNKNWRKKNEKNNNKQTWLNLALGMIFIKDRTTQHSHCMHIVPFLMNLCAMCCGFYQRFAQPKCKRTNCKCKYLMKKKKTQQTSTEICEKENNQIHKIVRHNLWLKWEFISSKMEYLLCHFIHWEHCIRI